MTTFAENNRIELEDIPGFEGPEKKIEVDFLLSPQVPEGLRKITEEDWKILLQEINCTILSKIENQFCDAYILSESSLFVFASKVIIKTCGQITLLKCMSLLMEYGKRVSALETRVSFSRRNLLFPEEQLSPHTSFEEEVLYLKQHFPTGNAYVFGPHNCDHHYMFVYHNEKVALPSKPPHSIEVLMTGLDKNVMKQFCRDENFVSVEELAHRSRIRSLFKDTTKFDAHAFEPIGFSLNSLEDDCYSTLHITPQPKCSYVSFETNDVDFSASHELVANVISIFKPTTFTVLVVSDSVFFKTEAFPEFTSRGMASHDFTGTGNVLTWYSFRASPIISPIASFQKLSDAITTAVTTEFHDKKLWEEEQSKTQIETFVQ
jgi:S-adenosylmethionine decarboxylase